MYSQAEEDEILAALLAQLGIERGTFVEIGVGPGVENNTLALARRPGWWGTWLGDEPVHNTPDTVHFEQATVTPDNVLGLLMHVTAPVDVFSIDIDGNDYWVADVVIPWLKPRIVIVEYYAPWTEPWIMRYTPGYRWHSGEPCGASLAAWQMRLAAEYDLVYTTRAQVNAFFVRRSSPDVRGGDVDDTLQSLIDSLKALAADVAKNEGRPSAQEISNRVGHAVILATTVQQNLQIAESAKTPPPQMGGTIGTGQTWTTWAGAVATGERSTLDDEPAVLGAGVGDTAIDDAPDSTDPPPAPEP